MYIFFLLYVLLSFSTTVALCLMLLEYNSDIIYQTLTKTNKWIKLDTLGFKVLVDLSLWFYAINYTIKSKFTIYFTHTLSHFYFLMQEINIYSFSNAKTLNNISLFSKI